MQGDSFEIEPACEIDSGDNVPDCSARLRYDERTSGHSLQRRDDTLHGRDLGDGDLWLCAFAWRLRYLLLLLLLLRRGRGRGESEG
jgi:hypothetical protein